MMNRAARRARRFKEAGISTAGGKTSSSAPKSPGQAQSKNTKFGHTKRKSSSQKAPMSADAAASNPRALKRQRQLEKPHGDKVLAAKELWNRLREHATEKNQKAELVGKIMQLLKGKIWEVVARHDASRVVQACFRDGDAEVQKQIVDSLAGKCYELATAQFGHHLIKCMLRHGTDKLRTRVLRELKGHVTRLAVHKTGASVLELIYQGHQGRTVAPNDMKMVLLRECYGREFIVYTQGKPSCDLAKFFSDSPASKENVLADILRLLNKIVAKGYHRFSFTHWLLAEYFTHASTDDCQSMVSSLTEATLELASTPVGAEVLVACLSIAAAKERKKIVKVFRQNSINIATHECGHMVLMRALDTVDDTVLMRKCAVNELAANMGSLVTDRCGSKVLLQLLAPFSTKYLPPQNITIFAQTEIISKKDAPTRRIEHLHTIRPALTAYVTDDTVGPMVASPMGRHILYEMIRLWAPEPAITALVGWLTAADMLEKLESFDVQTFIVRLCKLSQAEESDGDDTKGATQCFAVSLLRAIGERLSDLAMKNRAAYVVEALLRNSASEPKAKEVLQAHRDKLSDAASSTGSHSVKAVVGLLK